MKLYDAILQEGGCEDSDAVNYALGMVWGEIEAIEKPKPQFAKHLGDHNGVGVWYDFGADYYFFEELEENKPEPAKYSHATIEKAMNMLEGKIKEPDFVAKNPQDVKAYMVLKYMGKLNEVFGCLFMDNQHRVIEFEFLFFGTINSSSVHPRVVVQRALAHNAAAVILTHNHPSGCAEASLSDIDITHTLKNALNLIDVRVLDHLIVADHEVVSLAERGQI